MHLTLGCPLEQDQTQCWKADPRFEAILCFLLSKSIQEGLPPPEPRLVPLIRHWLRRIQFPFFQIYLLHDFSFDFSLAWHFLTKAEV